MQQAPRWRELTFCLHSDEYRQRKAAEAEEIDKAWGFDKFGEGEGDPRLGWLLNLVVTSVVGSDDVEHQALEWVLCLTSLGACLISLPHLPARRGQLTHTPTSLLFCNPLRRLFFLEQDGGTFKCITTYNRT